MQKIDALPMRILIIEDNNDIAFIEMCVFNNLGFDVAHIKDGDEAFQKVLAYKPHVIILDLELPGTQGPAIVSEILADDRMKHIPIVVDSVHVGNFSDPEGLDTQYFWAQYEKTKNKQPRIVKKSGEGESIFCLIAEVGLACGETYGVIPSKLMEHFKTMNPGTPPAFEVA